MDVEKPVFHCVEFCFLDEVLREDWVLAFVGHGVQLKAQAF